LPRKQEETDDPEIPMKRRLFLSGSNTVRLLSNLRAETGIFVLAMAWTGPSVRTVVRMWAVA